MLRVCEIGRQKGKAQTDYGCHTAYFYQKYRRNMGQTMLYNLYIYTYPTTHLTNIDISVMEIEWNDEKLTDVKRALYQ